MCEILDKYTKSKSVFGYKVVIKSTDEKYYSPFSGMKYSIGKVPRDYLSTVINANKNPEYAIPHKFSCILPNDNTFYEPKMKGKTGVILDITSAQKYLRQQRWATVGNFVLIKMCISGDLHNSKFGSFDTVTGNNIISIEELPY